MPFQAPAGRTLPDRGRLAWFGLATVLVFLTIFALVIAFATRNAGDEVRRSTLLSGAYERANTAVALEESLERKYRLEPGVEVRTRFRQASASLVIALDLARSVGNADDESLVTRVEALHVPYLASIDRMFDAVDAGDTGLVLRIDNGEVDPVFGSIETLVAGAAEAHATAAAESLARLGEADTISLTATPIVFVLGMILLFLARTAMHGFERRLEEGSLRELAEARASKERAVALDALGTQVASLVANQSPEVSGQAITEALCGLDGVDAATVFAFDGSGGATVLAISGKHLGLLEVGGDVPERRAADLLQRARVGAWTERWVPGPEDGEHGQRYAASGLIATAYAPIPGKDGPIGLLVSGMTDSASLERLPDHLAALADFAPSARMLLERALEIRYALARSRARIEATIDSGAFHPVFQPVVDLVTRRPIGYEALTRFDDGSRPDLFFAEARRCGLEERLEVATLGAALAASSVLPAGLFVSLNVSPGLIIAGEKLESILASRTRPIVLEITEHETIDDYEALRAAFVALGPGMRLAVDDAGAGIANFHHLVELRPDVVKIDIGLVRGVNTDVTRQALIVALLHFAAATDCQVVAEGIETEPERVVLKELEVQFGQGYLFGRPAVAAAWSRPSPAVTPRRSLRPVPTRVRPVA